MIVVRAHHFAPAEDDWRIRVLVAAERAARAAAPGSIAAIDDPLSDTAGQILVLSPAAGDAESRRTAEAVARELRASLHGFTFAVGYSRVALDPVDLYRAGNEALLAANVAEAGPGGEDGERRAPGGAGVRGDGRVPAAASRDERGPGRAAALLRRDRRAAGAYDEQYETDLVQTLETFLECDGNVANTAQRLFTHRHTVRYRLERVRDLCGLDVGSTDGREKLGLGLKAMRVLGIAAPRGPATERGAGGGRVPRGGPRALTRADGRERSHPLTNGPAASPRCCG